MSDLKQIFGENLALLRKEQNITQQTLAEKLNYSPKAISKWERGESMPEAEVLLQIADFFNVTVDFLLHKDSVLNRQNYIPEKVKDKNLLFNTILMATIIWTIIGVIFTYIILMKGQTKLELFLWGLPATCLVVAVAYRKKPRRFLAIILSIFLWTFLASLFIELLSTYNMYLIFIVGIPAQIAIFGWSRIIKIK